MTEVNSHKELEEIINLLKENELPFEDIGSSNIRFSVIKKGGAIIACGGLEVFDKVALLRSVAVKDGFKKQGLGSQLTEALLDEAAKNKIEAVYLLTTTAVDYFERKGFSMILKKEAPDAIKSSSEFSELCPDSAVFMRKKI